MNVAKQVVTAELKYLEKDTCFGSKPEPTKGTNKGNQIIDA